MEKSIRFIDSQYKNLFTVPDGGNVIVTNHYGERKALACKSVGDEMHAQIGSSIFHICEFAEIMERIGSVYAPEGGDCNRYEIYQITDKPVDYLFEPYEKAKTHLSRTHYTRTYWGVLASEVTLDDLFEKHNRDRRPFADTMRSLSMSDVIVLNRDGVESAFYADRFGFAEAPKFLSERIPEFCYIVLSSAGTLEMVKRGERRSLLSEHNTPDRKTNEILAKQKNRELGVTAAQAEGMLCGYLFGWDIPQAELSRKPDVPKPKRKPNSIAR